MTSCGPGVGRLVVITGLPGSGKTTLARELAASMSAVRMCPDDWMTTSGIDLWDADARDRIERFQWELALVCLAAGEDVIIEWGVWTRAERDALRDSARAIGAAVELRHVTATVDELWRRIAERDRQGAWASRPITRAELDEWHAAYETPSDEELATYDPAGCCPTASETSGFASPAFAPARAGRENLRVTTDLELATFAQMMALETHGADTFVGVGPRYPWGGLYGGQIVAQSLRAAGLTVDAGYVPHSLHAYFIRPGDHTEPIRFEVDRIRNGRSFTTRRVVARQSIGAILNLAASFHVPEEAVDVQPVTIAPGVGPVDSYLSNSWSHVFDRRHVDGDVGDPNRAAARAWMRMTEPVADDPLTQACALAYLSDDLPTEAVVTDHPQRVGIAAEADFDRTFMSASLDHAIWFHRPLDAGAWHLHDLGSRGLTGSRGLAVGEVFAEDGTHAATISQEVLLRVRR